MFEISVIFTPGLASLPELLAKLGSQSERMYPHRRAFHYNGGGEVDIRIIILLLTSPNNSTNIINLQ